MAFLAALGATWLLVSAFARVSTLAAARVGFMCLAVIAFVVIAAMSETWHSFVPGWAAESFLFLYPGCSWSGLLRFFLVPLIFGFFGLSLLAFVEVYSGVVRCVQQMDDVPTERYQTGYERGYREAYADALLSIMGFDEPWRRAGVGSVSLTDDRRVLVRVFCGCQPPNHAAECEKKHLVSSLQRHPWYERHEESTNPYRSDNFTTSAKVYLRLPENIKPSRVVVSHFATGFYKPPTGTF